MTATAVLRLKVSPRCGPLRRNLKIFSRISTTALYGNCIEKQTKPHLLSEELKFSLLPLGLKPNSLVNITPMISFPDVLQGSQANSTRRHAAFPKTPEPQVPWTPTWGRDSF